MIDHGFRVMLGHDKEQYPVIPVGFQKRRNKDGNTEIDLFYRFADFRGMKATKDKTVRLSREGHWTRLTDSLRHPAANE